MMVHGLSISTMRVFPVTRTRDYNIEYNLFSLLAIEHLKYNYENSAISVFIFCPARGIKGCFFVPLAGGDKNLMEYLSLKLQCLSVYQNHTSERGIC